MLLSVHTHFSKFTSCEHYFFSHEFAELVKSNINLQDFTIKHHYLWIPLMSALCNRITWLLKNSFSPPSSTLSISFTDFTPGTKMNWIPVHKYTKSNQKIRQLFCPNSPPGCSLSFFPSSALQTFQHSTGNVMFWVKLVSEIVNVMRDKG